MPSLKVIFINTYTNGNRTKYQTLYEATLGITQSNNVLQDIKTLFQDSNSHNNNTEENNKNSWINQDIGTKFKNIKSIIVNAHVTYLTKGNTDFDSESLDNQVKQNYINSEKKARIHSRIRWWLVLASILLAAMLLKIGTLVLIIVLFILLLLSAMTNTSGSSVQVPPNYDSGTYIIKSKTARITIGIISVVLFASAIFYYFLMVKPTRKKTRELELQGGLYKIIESLTLQNNIKTTLDISHTNQNDPDPMQLTFTAKAQNGFAMR